MPAAQAFYMASAAGSPLDIHEGGIRYPRAVSPTSSIATGCFNSCWALARNEWEAGRIDGFAMIHDDVGAQAYWLDILYREMQKCGADIISTVIPIKDARGLTSTAIDDTGDVTRVRRITMKQLRNMPQTFTDEDVPNLVLNTGLWLCKLGPWCLETHFHVENDIRRIDGKWQSVVFPEDWHFSRQCRKLGLKLAATKAVRVDHYGGHRWCNQDVWGWEIDAQNAAGHTVVPEDWKFPDEVDGWLTEREGRYLAEGACGKSVLEIGAYCGRSTICMAQTAKVVYTVDPFDGRDTPDKRDTLDEFTQNLDRYGLTGRVMFAQGTSSDIIPPMSETFDMAFIDGAHDFDSVMRDASLVAPRLTSNGLVYFHDYQKYGNEQVTQAVDYLRTRGAELVRVVDSVAVLRNMAA